MKFSTPSTKQTLHTAIMVVILSTTLLLTGCATYYYEQQEHDWPAGGGEQVSTNGTPQSEWINDE